MNHQKQEYVPRKYDKTQHGRASEAEVALLSVQDELISFMNMFRVRSQHVGVLLVYLGDVLLSLCLFLCEFHTLAIIHMNIHE